MDWIKREMYMAAKEKLESCEEAFVCHALIAVLAEYGLVYSEQAEFTSEDWNSWNNLDDQDKCHYKVEKLLQEFFPEFMRLNDGKIWNEYGNFRKQIGIQDMWWDKWPQWPWGDPRILILDTILRD